MFILEVIVTTIIAVILALLFIIVPAAFLWMVIRKALLHMSGGKIDLFTRQEKIDLGLHEPGTGYYSEDVFRRAGKEEWEKQKEVRKVLTMHPASFEYDDEDDDDQSDVAFMMMRRAANNLNCQDEMLAYRKKARRKRGRKY